MSAVAGMKMDAALAEAMEKIPSKTMRRVYFIF
jgi:hypothetical protein